MENNIPIIIPAYEPDQRLLQLVEKLTQTNLTPIVIVDDGSGADYQPVFQACESRCRAVVLHHPSNSGKGRALKTGFSYCLKHLDPAGCITADADGQHTPEAINTCRNAMIRDPQALVLGVRDFSADTVPAKSRFGNQLTRTVFRILYRTDVSDTQTGLRGIPASYMKELLTLPGERFEFETQMLIDAVSRRIPFAEIPIETVYDSKEHHATHFRPVTDSLKVYMSFTPAFGRFILSSLSSSLIDLALFQIFCMVLKRTASGFGYAAAAAVMARIISAACNYLINYKLVFVSRKKHSRSALQYAALAVFQMALSAALTTAALYATHAEPELLVKIPVDTVLFFLSYRIQKKYIY